MVTAGPWAISEWDNARMDRFGRYLDFYPFDSPWVRAKARNWAAKWLLPLWFVVNSAPMLLYFVFSPGSFGFDVRLYRLAADAWLAGQNPWMPSLYFDPFHLAFNYAGPPPTLIPSILLAWVPIDDLVLAVALFSGGVAMWTLRRLGLPMWWMLFPPIVAGFWVGNLNIFVVALLLSGAPLAGGVAIVLKIYAALPSLILWRWKALVVAGSIMLVSFPFLPWSQFLTEYPRISAALTSQAWGGETSFLTTPFVTVGAGIGLILLGRERAAWLAVPVLWPATQLHYTVMALPALSPVLAAFAAVNHPGFLGVGVICYALWVRRDLLHRPRLARIHRMRPDPN
jgi:hypothetical protein